MEEIQMNAIDFLIKEHNRVRKMLKTICDEPHQFAAQKEQFQILSENLIRHEAMEHEVWYPRLKEQLPETVKHLITEEKHAENAIKKMSDLKTEDAWNELFLQLKEKVEQHACEEENELFPEVEKIFSEKELEKIGLEMFDFKKDYSEKIH